MFSTDAERLHKQLLSTVYDAAKSATAHVRIDGSGSTQEVFIRRFATLEGLMKLAAEILADEFDQAPGVEEAMRDDILAALDQFLTEEKIARTAPATAIHQ